MARPKSAARDDLVRALNRVLDQGAFLDADILIGVAGVPLVALRLRALLAGVETMEQYGLMAADGTIAQAPPGKRGDPLPHAEARKPIAGEDLPRRPQQPARSRAQTTSVIA